MHATIEFDRHANPKRLGVPRRFDKRRHCDYDFCGCRRTRFLWISHKLNAIYFDIPKCASQTLRSAFGVLGSHAGIDPTARALARLNITDTDQQIRYVSNDVYEEKSEYPKAAITLKNRMHTSIQSHSKAIEEKEWTVGSPDKTTGFQLLDLSPDDAIEAFPNYFKFTFVRCPYQRAESAYLMMKRKINEPETQRMWRSLFGNGVFPRSLDEFLEYIAQRSNCHWRSVQDFLPDVEGMKQMNFIGTLENFSESLKVLKKNLKLQAEFEWLNSRNNSVKKSSPISKYSKERIADLYSYDLDLFDRIR